MHHLVTVPLLLLLGVVLGLPSTRRLLTIYDGQKTSWNFAVEICERASQILLTVDTEDVLTALSTKSVSDFWTGLHDFNDDPGVEYYAWSTSCEPLGSYRPWNTHDNTDKERCIRGKGSLDPESLWETRDCSSQDGEAICEKQIGDCIFDDRQYDVDLMMLSSFVQVIITNITQTECQASCLSYAVPQNQTECWGFKYATNCRLYVGKTYTDFLRILTGGTTRLYLKNCFMVGMKEFSPDNTKYENTEDKIPWKGCTEFATTTVHTTTTTTQVLTTTAASTTAEYSTEFVTTTTQPVTTTTESATTTEPITTTTKPVTTTTEPITTTTEPVTTATESATTTEPITTTTEPATTTEPITTTTDTVILVANYTMAFEAMGTGTALGDPTPNGTGGETRTEPSPSEDSTSAELFTQIITESATAQTKATTTMVLETSTEATSRVEPQTTTNGTVTSKSASTTTSLYSNELSTLAMESISTPSFPAEFTMQTETTQDAQGCFCNCLVLSNLTDAEKAEFIRSILKNLTIDIRATSSSRRKYTSASDHRPSAKYVGTLGIALLTVTFVGLFLLDLQALIRDIKTFIETIKQLRY